MHCSRNSMWEEMMQGEKNLLCKTRRAIRRLAKAADEENITAYIYGGQRLRQNGTGHAISEEPEIYAV